MKFFRQIFCRHKTGEYIGLIQCIDGFKVVVRCCRCDKVEIGKGILRG